jgi:acetylornithine deacetylase
MPGARTPANPDLRGSVRKPIMPAMSRRLPDMESMVRDLVSRPSVSSVRPDLDTSNAAVCERLAGWLENLGFAVRLEPVPGQVGKINLIAAAGRGDGGLVLSGHADTVPFDEHLWDMDPFSGVVRDGRLYGLGATDMKGFFAAACHAAARLPLQRLRRPLVILATADEESGMSGARALTDAGERLGACAVIGEPTGLAPVTLHKGILMEAIHVVGSSGHSSDPALGRNALEGMLEVADELRRFRADLAARWPAPEFEVPYPTLNLGRISGGDNPNRICGECELAIDVRLVPGMTVAATREELRARILARLQGSSLEVRFRPLFTGVDPLRPGTHDPGHAERCQRLSGKPAGAVAFCTEAPFFQQLDMDTVVMGPGDIRLAHQPNEWVGLGELARCADLLERLAAEYCLADQP